MNLETVLAYKNQPVLDRYQKEYPNNKLTAKEAMTELLKFFWLLNHRKEASMSDPNNQDLQFHCAMHREMHEIDDMWHTFLLFTQDYAEFSMNYFGYFLHHSPNTEGGDHESEAYKEELTKYLSYIYDHLGEKTLRTWFAETLLGEFV